MGEWENCIEGDAYGDKEMSKSFKNQFKKETLKEVLYFGFHDWPERNLKKEILEKFGVRVKLSEVDQSVEKVFFPSYDQNDKLVGFKCKDITKSGEKDEYYTIGKVTKKNKLFGAKQARESAKYLVITEGEVDCLSAYQGMIEYFKGFTNWNRKLTPAVVTFSAGAVQAVNHLSHNEKFLRKFQEFRLAFDNDEVSDIEKLTTKNNIIRGKECTENVGCYLLSNHSDKGKREIFVAELDEKYNDCSDYLQDKKEKELGKQLAEKKRLSVFSAEKIISVEDITIEELLKPKEKGVYIDSFPKLMDKLWGIRKKELTVFTALSGTGKTVCVSEIGYKLAEQSKEKVALVFLEENSDETILRMIARKLQVNYYKFVFEPLKHCTRKQFEDAYEWVKGKFFFLDVFGAMSQESLINSFKSLYYVSDCGYIVFDHLGMLGGQKGLINERRMIDEAMTELASWVAQTDVGVIAVSHLSRAAQQEIGKLSDIKEAKWINVRKEHLRGCLSNDSSYLCKGKGWKRFDEYEDGDEILQYNQDGTVEFVKPEAYIELPCDEMWEFKSKSLNMKLSDEHRVIYRERNKKIAPLTEITAKDLVKRHKKFKGGFGGQIPKTFKRKGGECNYTEQELRIQVMINADGCITNHNTNHCCIGVKKNRKKERAIELLGDKLTNNYETKDGVSLFYAYMPFPNKGFTDEYYDFPQWALEIIIDELQYWDCTLKTRRFSTVEKRDIDFISYAYSCCGYRTKTNYNYEQKCNDGRNRKLIHYVNVSKHPYGSLRNDGSYSNVSIERVKTEDGKKYCFTTKSGMFVAQRDGKIFVTGNSASLEQLAWNVIALDMLLEPNRERSDVRLTVLKNRSIGLLGTTDQFHLDGKGLIELVNHSGGY